MKEHKLTRKQFKEVFKYYKGHIRRWAFPFCVAYAHRNPWGGFTVSVKAKWWVYLLFLPTAIIYEVIQLLWDGGLKEFELPYNKDDFEFSRIDHSNPATLDMLDQICGIEEKKDS